jgi:cytochrome c oxidase subunit 2
MAVGWTRSTYLLAVSVFFATLNALLVIVFAIRYRRRSESELPRGLEGSLKLEIAWTVIPLFIALSFFFWGAKIFFAMHRVPDDAIEVNVIGKQWMGRSSTPTASGKSTSCTSRSGGRCA